jgi:hypothetical protein
MVVNTKILAMIASFSGREADQTDVKKINVNAITAGRKDEEKRKQ